MNLLLLADSDFVAADRARVDGRRHRHARDVLRAAPGDELAVGRRGGRLGRGRVLAIGDDALELAVELDTEPPAKLPLTLVLALPRPKVLRRVLQSATALGARRIVLLHAARVEKSYWQSPFLAPAAIERQLLLGLEQAGDTILPEIALERRFRPFAEDRLPALAAGTRALAADPRAAAPCPRAVQGAATLAIGPEGGFVPFELGLLARAGLEPVHLGPRVLRVETAVPALVGRIF